MPSLKIDITQYTLPFIISTASCLWSPDVGLAGKFLSPWRTCLSQFIFQPQPNPRQQKIDKDNCSNLETSVNISATKAGLRNKLKQQHKKPIYLASANQLHWKFKIEAQLNNSTRRSHPKEVSSHGTSGVI